MTYDDLIAHFGSARKAARHLGVTDPAVAMWRKRGSIPVGRQALIQIQTRGRLRAEQPGTVPEVVAQPAFHVEHE